MAALRALVEELGYGNVRTLLNSGNVVFESAATSTGNEARRIEEGLAARTGVSARVIVLTARELADIVDGNPLAALADDPSRLLVTVLRSPADAKLLEPLLEGDWAPDSFALGRRAAYVWCARETLASRLATEVGRRIGDSGTSRNWATITKLAAMTDGPYS